MNRILAVIYMAVYAAMVACGGGEGGQNPTEPPTKTPTINITLTLDTSVTNFPGAMLRAKGDVRDETGTPVSTGMTWELNGVAIGEVGEVEKTLTPGSYSLCLSFRGKKECKDVSVASPQPVRGRVFEVSSRGVGIPSGLKVCANWGGSPECTDVSPAGEYSLVTRFTRSDSIEFSVRCSGACPNLVVPTDTVSRDEFGSVKNFSVLNKRWEVLQGSWKGSVVSISPQKAYARALDGLSFWNEDRRYFWRQQDFPIKVFFDRETYGVPITAEDSITFWSYLNEIEAEAGKDLFTPGNAEGMTVTRNPPGLPAYQGGIGITVRPDSFIARGSALPSGKETLGGGGAYFSLHPLSSIRVRFVVKHELMHALGFGHTPHQSWYPGVMTNFQKNWEPTHGYLALEEVAYMEAWYVFMELAWREKSSTMLDLLGSGG